jgi:hypothetical protein
MSDRAMRLTNDQRLPLDIELSYQSLRLPRKERTTKKVLVYSPGAMSWADGVAPAAAFITVRDDVVDQLARRAVTESTVPRQGILRRENLAHAAAVFDAVRTIGVRYVPDPTSPFASPAAKQGGFDTINYPRQTLDRKAGDCDDLTVLMASLLGNVGIATRLVDVPGHILLMFDSGIKPAERSGLGLPDYMTVERDGIAWAPLETTSLDEGFAHAWETGASLVARRLADGEPKGMFVDVAKAMVDYEPALPTGAAPALEFDRNQFASRYASDRDTLDAWLASTELNDKNRGNLLAAHDEWESGNYAEVGKILDEVARGNGETASVLNNLGDVAFATDSLARAGAYYQRARELDPHNPGIQLNIGLLAFALGDTTAGLDALGEGVISAGGDVAAARILGVPDTGETTSPLKESPPRLTPAEIRALLIRAGRRAPSSLPRPAPGAKTNIVSKMAGSRASRPQEFVRYLYWRP